MQNEKEQQVSFGKPRTVILGSEDEKDEIVSAVFMRVEIDFVIKNLKIGEKISPDSVLKLYLNQK